MLSVTVFINGQPILSRSCVNGGEIAPGRCRYHVDDGSTVLHDVNDGAAALAVQLLGTIREPTRSGHKPPRTRKAEHEAPRGRWNGIGEP